MCDVELSDHLCKVVLLFYYGENIIMAEKSIPVSVIMPVYNAGVYLKPALESLLKQTLKEIEIIAVDDGSTDGSGQLLAEYAARDKRLKVIFLKRSGAAAARNRGIEAARGKWLWFADADDIAAPDLAEKMYRRGEETDSDMVICQANFLDVDGKTPLPLTGCRRRNRFPCRMPERSFSPTPPSGTNFTVTILSLTKTSASKTFLPATTLLLVRLP